MNQEKSRYNRLSDRSITVKLYLRKAYCLICCLLGFAIYGFAQLPVNATLFNDGWAFHKGDLTASELSQKDNNSLWHPVDLPHDWSIKEPFSPKWASATGYLPGGIGWYRKTFKIQESGAATRPAIYFEGIYKNSKVWLNGHLLGERPNGFVSFFYDLTPFLKRKGLNELLVKVDHSDFADSRWYTGSGIYRNVFLVNLSVVNMPIWGVHAETASIGDQQASLHVQVNIDNTTVSAKTVTVENILMDSSGAKLSGVSRQFSLAGGENIMVDTTFGVIAPRRWSITDPYLYTLLTTLKVEGKKVEQYKTRVGLRTLRFSADSGLFLNGKNLKLKGVCIHDDAGSFGTAAPLAIWKERLKLLKAAGCNAIRMTHNPHSSDIYNLCDQMGFLIIDEAFDEWALGKHKWITGWNDGTPGTDGYHSDFKKWWKRDLTAMIRRDRNHPSVIMWSIGNEIDYPNDPYSDPVLSEGHYPQIYGSGYMPSHPAASALGGIARELAAVVRTLDSTRPVTAGLAAVMVADKVGYTQTLDAAGYNYQEYRYDGDHKLYPNRIIYGSENGHGYNGWKAVIDHPFVIGQFLWTGVDYLGEASKWPSHGNEAGLISLSNFRKPEYYFRQSIWSDSPMVYLGTSKSYRRLNLKNGRHAMARSDWNYKPGDTVNVYCYTNCKEATLYLNQKSLGMKGQNDSTHVIVWRVPFQPGLLSVKAAISNEKGIYIADSIHSFNKAALIKTSYYALDRVSNEKQIYAVDILVTDKAGHNVLTDSSMLQIQVTGDGKLIGLENGNIRDPQTYGGHQRRVYHGRLRAYVQSLRPGHNIQVDVRCVKGLSQSLKEAQFKIML